MTEQMKPSGIAWIGDIPESWQIGRIKDYYVLQTGFTPDTSMPEYYDDENGAYWVSISDIDNSRSIKDTKAKISKYYIAEKHPELSPAGSLLYSFKLSVGKVAFLDKDMYTNEAIASFIDTNNIHLPFLYYSAIFIEENANTNIYGAKILNQDLIKNSYTIFPPLSEQKIIAAFLDTQCAKIDSIIADIEKQIETLQKYKKSLITETVTKGLDKSAPMKDSGSSWYMTIPQHWKMCRIKDVIELLTDYTANGSFQSLADNVEYLDYESFARVVRLTDLRVNMDNYGIYVDEHAYAFLAKSALFGGEVLVANVGAYAGLFCEMPKVSFNATLGPNMYMILTNQTIISQHYLYLLGHSNNVCEQLNIKATASAQPKLNKTDVKGVYIPVPPLNEQEEIAQYLDDKLKKTDAIIDDKQKQLATIQRHKKSLIYEYVTGKKRVTEVN